VLVDSHCHLQDPKFKSDVDSVIARAVNAGVTAMVTVGYDMPSSRRAIEIADSYENVYATIGVHPHDARTLKPKDVEELARMADSAKVVAVGEIGFDFYRNLSPREEQERAFHAQLELARSLSLPVVIHSRDADEDTYAVLAEYENQARPDWPKDRPIGVMHCYAGDLPLALRYIEIGFVISIAGTVTYPNNKSGRAVAGGIPHEMLLLDLYEALHGLDAITGATTADDILNRIFSTFCIGK